MKSFNSGLRVKVIAHDDPNMIGNVGTVVRCRIGDDGAWVRMDKGFDTEDFPFHGQMQESPHHNLPDHRVNHTLLYPEQCEAV